MHYFGSMTIGRKLYVTFGFVLAMVVMLFLITFVAVRRERLPKRAQPSHWNLRESMDKIKFQMMQNRLYLGNYLLSGDTREIDHMNEGMQTLTQKIQDTETSPLRSDESSLEQVAQSEQGWGNEFAAPMVKKRKDVDEGNATVAELQIFYLQKDSASWVKSTTQYLDNVDHENSKLVDERRTSDETASSWTIGIALIFTIVAVVLGSMISFSTSRSITAP